jgi:hypothetical protein
MTGDKGGERAEQTCGMKAGERIANYPIASREK